MNNVNPVPFQRYAHDRALGSTVPPQDISSSAAPEQHTIRHKMSEALSGLRDTLLKTALSERQVAKDK